MIAGRSSTVLAGVKGPLRRARNGVVPALDPGCAPCSMPRISAGLRHGAVLPKPSNTSRSCHDPTAGFWLTAGRPTA